MHVRGRSSPRESCAVLAQVCCNLATMTHPLFDKQPVPYALSPKVSNPRSMEAALEVAVDMLSKARSSVVLSGCSLPSQVLPISLEVLSYFETSLLQHGAHA